MKQKGHRYRRLFASDLLKVDKDTTNVNYNNDRAAQLNKVEIEKPIEDKPIKEKKVVDKPTIEEPQQIRKSNRERKEKKDEDYIY